MQHTHNSQKFKAMNIDKCNGEYKHGRSKPVKCSDRWGCKWFDWRHGKTKSKPKPSSTAHKCSEHIGSIEYYQKHKSK